MSTPLLTVRFRLLLLLIRVWRWAEDAARGRRVAAQKACAATVKKIERALPE